MVTNYTKKNLLAVPITKLKPHPQQCVFPNHTPAQIEDLADDMSRNGQVSPVEVTPDYVIICGHGRVEAARQLGWETITCWIRDDLAAAGEEAVFRRLAEDNLHRRQLTKLGMARVYLALHEQLREEWAASASEGPLGDFRDFLGERLNCDGTTAERWSKLAVLPLFVDALLDQGCMTFAQAQLLVHQPEKKRNQILDQLAAIAELDLPRAQKKGQIRDLLAATTAAKRKPRQATPWLETLCKHCEKVLAELPPQYAKVYLAEPAEEPVCAAIDLIRAGLPSSAARHSPLPAGSQEALRDAATVLLQLVARIDSVEAD